jgi:sec-independent protein translocase protein TatA
MLEGLFQPMHLIVILAIALLVVGPKKLPELGAGIGKSIREFKKAMSDMDKPAIDTPPAGEVKQEIIKDTKDAG